MRANYCAKCACENLRNESLKCKHNTNTVIDIREVEARRKEQKRRETEYNNTVKLLKLMNRAMITTMKNDKDKTHEVTGINYDIWQYWELIPLTYEEECKTELDNK